MPLRIMRSNIATMRANAIINTTKESLAVGGVVGNIHRATGTGDTDRVSPPGRYKIG